jgi:hypothetical protein
LEAITRLTNTDRADDLPSAVYDLLYQCNLVLVGEAEWEPSLADAARDWYGRTMPTGADTGWWPVREHISRAADAFQQAVRPWLHVPVDQNGAAMLVGPLVQGCAEALAQLSTEH